MPKQMFDEISRNMMGRSARKRRDIITPNSKIVIDLRQTTLIHEGNLGYWSLTNIPIPNNSGGTFELRCMTVPDLSRALNAYHRMAR